MRPGNDPGIAELKFRDPQRARRLTAALQRTVDQIGRPTSVMHVCGSHEQAIARFGLRAAFPKSLNVIEPCAFVVRAVALIDPSEPAGPPVPGSYAVPPSVAVS